MQSNKFISNEFSLSNRSFGPNANKQQVPSKLESVEPARTAQKKVSFQDDHKVIIVENWKQYNVDVSVQQNSPSKNSKTTCVQICSIF